MISVNDISYVCGAFDFEHFNFLYYLDSISLLKWNAFPTRDCAVLMIVILNAM